MDFGVPLVKLAEDDFGPDGDDFVVAEQVCEIGKGRGASYRIEKATTWTVWHDGSGMSCGDNKLLAVRLVKALKAGYKFRDFLGRTLNADLKRIGF